MDYNPADNEMADAISTLIAPHFDDIRPMITGWFVCVEVIDTEDGRIYAINKGDSMSPYWKHLGMLEAGKMDIKHTVDYGHGEE